MYNGTVSNYVSDILRNYGDRGRPIQMPQPDHDLYEQGMKFREREKQHYKDLETRNQQLEAKMKVKDMAILNLYNQHMKLTEEVSNFLEKQQKGNDPGGGGRRGGDTGGDSGAGVLPADGDSREADSHDGQAGTIISGREATDVSSSHRARGSRGRDAQHAQQAGGPSDEASTAGNDAGGTPPDPPDRTETEEGR